MIFKVYLIGPISGLPYDEVMSRLQWFVASLPHCEILSPMTGKEYLRGETKLKPSDYFYGASTNHAIFERDKWMIGQCDIALADFIGAKNVSIGSMFELAWASYLNKHTLVIMEENNIHHHSFVLEAADIIFQEALDAFQYINKLLAM